MFTGSTSPCLGTSVRFDVSGLHVDVAKVKHRVLALAQPKNETLMGSIKTST